MRKFIISILSMLIFMTTSMAQNNISGTVTDEQEQPLIGASVYIPELNMGTQTDDKGFYHLENLPNTTLDFVFSYIGYANTVKNINPSEVIELNVKLIESYIEGEEIIITAGFNATQHTNAVKVDVEKINTIQNIHQTGLMQMIEKVPGVSMISKGSGITKPVIRGLSLNDVLVLNNGVRFENYQYSNHHALGIDEQEIGSVEIIKGPASLLYGSDAIGGVVNFIREKTATVGSVEGNFTSKYFSNAEGYNNQLSVKGSGENIFGSISVGQKSHADYIQGDGQFVPNSRFDEKSIKARIGSTNNLGTFNLFYDFGKQSYGLVTEEINEFITERGRSVDIDSQNLTSHVLSSQNTFRLGNQKLYVNAALQQTVLAHINSFAEKNIEMRLRTLTYEAKWKSPLGTDFENIFGFQGYNQTNRNINDRTITLLPDADVNTYSVFNLLQYDGIDKLKVQGGLRYDLKYLSTESIGNVSDFNYRPEVDKDYNSVSGSVGLTYKLSDFTFIRANIASAFRTPNIPELTSNGPHEAIYELGNADLLPEKSMEYDVSMHYHKGDFTVDLAGFYNNIKDYIYIAPTGETSVVSLPIYQFTQSDAMLYGSEFGVHYHPKSLKLLHLESTFSNVIGQKDDETYLPFIPANRLTFDVMIQPEQWGKIYKPFVAVETSHHFEQNKVADNEDITSTYTLMDINLGATLHWKKQDINLGLSVQNVFDKLYIDHLSVLKEANYYNPGRNFVLTLNVPFNF